MTAAASPAEMSRAEKGYLSHTSRGGKGVGSMFFTRSASSPVYVSSEANTLNGGGRGAACVKTSAFMRPVERIV